MSHKVSQYDDKIVVDDVIYPYPIRVKNSNTNNLIVKNDLIIVNGYSLDLISKTFSEDKTGHLLLTPCEVEDEDVQLTHQEIAEGVGMILAFCILGALAVALGVGAIVYFNLI